MCEPWIRWFDELTLDDVPLVGGKNASLGELRRALGPLGVRVPDGFATTVRAYRVFLHNGGLEGVVEQALGGLDVTEPERLQRAGRRVRAAILETELPRCLADEVRAAYRRLEAEHGSHCDVAVRSSATAGDLPEASFAGQQESYLNVRGEQVLLDAVRRCFASLFTDRAIVHRAGRGFDHLQAALSVGVQAMVRSDLGGAGVMSSIDPESGFRETVLVNAAWGLGESVVQGTVSPDEHRVFKPTLRQGFRPILKRRLGSKELKLVYDEGGTRRTRTVPVPPEERARFVLTDDEVLLLARWAVAVEDHYSARCGVPTPVEMEWARDGRTGELFLLQARPGTVRAGPEAPLPRDGVGLARLDLIAGSHVRAHPMALLHPERVAHPGDRAELERLGPEHFVDRLAEGVGAIAAASWPREVVARLSGFGSSEYAGLPGGAAFGPAEEYPAPGFREVFALECRALRRVRDEMGLRNLKLTVPLCRTPEEGRRVLEELARNGLRCGEDGLEMERAAAPLREEPAEAEAALVPA